MEKYTDVRRRDHKNVLSYQVITFSKKKHSPVTSHYSATQMKFYKREK